MKPQIEESNFIEMINESIAKGLHKGYLEKVKEDFDRYIKFFDENVFVEKEEDDAVYKFRVTYLRTSPFWHGGVWREIEILNYQTFETLADEIVFAMGWANDHMHGFSVPDPNLKSGKYVASPYTFFCEGWEDDPHPTFKTNQISIKQLNWEKFPKLLFEFDFGDSHTFSVEYNGQRKIAKKEIKSYFPKLIDQRGVGPEQYPQYE